MTSALSTQEREQSGNRAAGWLSVALVMLAVGSATTSVLGPVGLGLMRYRTSPTTLNQLLGSDAASLFVVAPLTLVAAVLTARRYPVGPLLALGVGVYALYTYAQIIIGQEYLRLPGNVERFFPLLLAVFLVAEAVVVLAWRLAPPTPRPTPRLERTAAVNPPACPETYWFESQRFAGLCLIVVSGLQFGGCDVAAVLVEAAVVVPVDPFGGGQLDLRRRFATVPAA